MRLRTNMPVLTIVIVLRVVTVERKLPPLAQKTEWRATHSGSWDSLALLPHVRRLACFYQLQRSAVQFFAKPRFLPSLRFEGTDLGSVSMKAQMCERETKRGRQVTRFLNRGC